MLDNVGLRYPHRASGAKVPRTLRPLPLLRFAVSATGGAHLCSIQYYLRFWLGICRTSLTVSALRIMRYCPKKYLQGTMLASPPECLSGEEHLKECVAYFGRRAHTVRPLRVAYTSQYNKTKDPGTIFIPKSCRDLYYSMRSRLKFFAEAFFQKGWKGKLKINPCSFCWWPSCAGRGPGCACGCADSPE